MRDPQSILITGASSGIGAALATAYARPGVALHLSGRDAARLEATAQACRAKGAEARTAVLDVADRAAMADWVTGVDDARPLDLIVANAGISGGTGGSGEAEEQARRIFAVNLDGVLNAIHPAIPRMQARRRGQIALMASLAGFRGLPTAPAYSASKAAVRAYGEGLRGCLARDGVEISVICPGFVESGITAVNRFPMPFLMPAERAAAIVKRGLARNRARIAFPFPTYFGAWALGALPAALGDLLLARAPAKE